MKQRTVFYSWQSDLPNGTNRSFIENCLTKAIKGLRVARPELDVCLDRDTANVPGSPDIAATILDKIDNCHLFVCDVSIVQRVTRPTPNPNVLFELGYAVKRLGWERVICVANSHFGAIESLPFDVRKRRVKGYALSPEITDRTEAARSLTSVLEREIELILTTTQEEGERLQLQFGDIDTKTPLGKSLQHHAVFYSCDLEAIPDYDCSEQGGPFEIVAVRVGRPNRDYHRQLAQYVQHSLALRKTGFVVFNGNPIAINDLTMEIVVKKSHGLVILDDEPIRPSESEMDKIVRSINPITSHFAPPGRVSVNELRDRYEVRVEFGKIQPEANAWSEPIFIGTNETCKLPLPAALYADELATPVQVSLDVSFEVTEAPIDKLPEEEFTRLMSDS